MWSEKGEKHESLWRSRGCGYTKCCIQGSFVAGEPELEYQYLNPHSACLTIPYECCRYDLIWHVTPKCLREGVKIKVGLLPFIHLGAP
jgi:hypothetical protein